jgi:hypothetical protein
MMMNASCLQLWSARRARQESKKVAVRKKPISGMEAVVIHSESPSRLETYFYLVIMMACARVVRVVR